MTRYRSFLDGLGLTAFASAASWLLVRFGFRNDWYLGQLLPIFMVLYILLAWLFYLRRTSAIPERPHRDSPHDLPEDRISGKELLGVRDEHGLVRRRPQEKDNRVESFLQDPVSALLWSAAQLGTLATVLYHISGIGARFF